MRCRGRLGGNCCLFRLITFLAAGQIVSRFLIILDLHIVIDTEGAIASDQTMKSEILHDALGTAFASTHFVKWSTAKMMNFFCPAAGENGPGISIPTWKKAIELAMGVALWSAGMGNFISTLVKNAFYERKASRPCLDSSKLKWVARNGANISVDVILSVFLSSCNAGRILTWFQQDPKQSLGVSARQSIPILQHDSSWQFYISTAFTISCWKPF
ncbi:hypothetical protein CRG98_030273 [Punica granatum]|uniref:Uncharacterized protein n=1 Tax=Punica granatum TaxID=22663 RepID=A0A2I0IZD3_PUNGR|nr:hypothetical protein CRG98_030273 [Punica granatum]